VLAGAVFAFDGGHLQMGRGHLRLHEELAPGGADADDLDERLGFGFNEGKPGEGGWAGSERRFASVSTCLSSVAQGRWIGSTVDSSAVRRET
jgi:hypothetical protein